MKFNLVDGEVKFLTHKVEYEQKGETIVREFYDEDKKNAFVDRLQERNIEYTVTEYEQPSQDIIDRVAGKKFNTIKEAKAFIDGNLPLEPIDILGQRIFKLETKILELGGEL